MVIVVSAVTLFCALSVLADAPVFDISQQTSVQTISSTETETGDTSDVSISTTPPATVPEIPTENLAPPTTSTATDSTGNKRLARLEQQINNIANMNLPQQLIDLQQELARISGQLQVQEHNLQLLNNQQCSFYQDLNQKITKLKNLNGVSTPNDNISFKQSSWHNSIPGNEKIQLLQDSNTYQAGLDLLTKKKYEKSEAAFQNYLDDYPNGNYVANAHYWLGEIYLQQKNTHKAAIEFQVVRDKFLKSEKILDAKLKLAIIHMKMGKTAEAKRELMEIKKCHPESTVARLASVCLQQLESATSQH